MTTKKQEKVTEISIPEMKRQFLEIVIKGTSSLIVHKFSDKTKREMAEKHQGKANKGKKPKDPIADFVYSLHIMNGIKPEQLIEKLHKAKIAIGSDVAKHFKDIPLGFPACGFKKAAVSACRNVDGVPMTLARGAFFVKEDANGCIEIKYKKLIFREDMVRLNGKVPDVRYRGGFEDWSATLNVESNPNVLSPEWVCNLIDTSGFAVGLGEHRPEKDGSNGMFMLKR